MPYTSSGAISSVSTNNYSSFWGYGVKTKYSYAYRADGNMRQEKLESRTSTGLQVSHWEDFYYNTIPVSIDRVIPELMINVYPQPSSDYVVFKWDNYPPQADLQIFNMEGRKIWQQGIQSGIPISVSSFSTGIYGYLIKSGNASFKGKFIKS